MTILRHLVSIALLPFMVAIVIPRWLLQAYWTSDSHWGVAVAPTMRVVGWGIFTLGLLLFGWCVWLFGRVGKGTLAPWDPTRRLVAIGPYRHVRNPMITSVATMLVGEAVANGSRVLAIWCALFIALNHVYFLVVEEPGLVRRFGDDYVRYRGHVPRWIPRWSPYLDRGGK